MMRGNLTNCIRIVPNQAVGVLLQCIVCCKAAPCWVRACAEWRLRLPQVKFLTYEQLSRLVSHEMMEVGYRVASSPFGWEQHAKEPCHHTAHDAFPTAPLTMCHPVRL